MHNEWFAVAMNAAAALEDAANCLRDPDAKKSAIGAAEHVRARIRELDSRAAPADKQGGGLSDATPFVREFEEWVKQTGALPWGGSWMAEVSSIIERAVLARVAPSEQRDELGLTKSDWRKIEQQAEQPAEEARGVVAYMRPDTGAVVRASQKAPGMTLDDFTVPLVPLAAPAAATAQDYEAVLADHRRLVRELDVLLNGDAAAKQASLCDIVAQVRRGGIKAATGAQGLTDIQRAALEWAIDKAEAQELAGIAAPLRAILAASQPHGGTERG